MIWKPIETAPKKTPVMVCKFIGDEWCFCKSSLEYDSGHLDGVAPYWFWTSDHDANSITEDDGPEYWADLPEFPTI